MVLDRSESGNSRQGALHTHRPLVHHMRIDHGGTNIAVAEQLLNGADVVAVFQQMRGETMAQRMTTGMLINPGPGFGCFQPFIQRRIIQMMTAYLVRTQVF